MAKNNTKKIEQLRSKISELNEKIEAAKKQKAQYEKELETLQLNSLATIVKAKKIVIDEEFFQSVELAAKIRNSGLNASDIEELLLPVSQTPEDNETEEKANV